MLEAAGEDTTEAAARLAKWRAVEKDFCRQTGLPRDSARSQVHGFGRSQASKAVQVAKLNTLTNATGKLIIKVKHTTTSDIPNSITQMTNAKDGIDRNYYDSAGRQFKQISNNDHDKPQMHLFGEHGEHAHDYVWDEDGKLIKRPMRELNDTERKENGDIL